MMGISDNDVSIRENLVTRAKKKKKKAKKKMQNELVPTLKAMCSKK
jgi:hypothetical protein